MRPGSSLRVVAFSCLLMLGALGSASAPAFGAVPNNDDWANAKPINALPATLHANTTNATTETDEPRYCSGDAKTVWFKVTSSTDTGIFVDLKDSAIQAGISVWRGNSLTSLHSVACGEISDFMPVPRLTFAAKAGKTYYIQIDSSHYLGPDDYQGGPITLHLKRVTLPSNDDFSGASSISLPFHETVSNLKATRQPNEPEFDRCLFVTDTRWYKVRLPQTSAVRADTFGTDLDTLIGIYSGGPAIGALTPVACSDDTSNNNQSVYSSSVAWVAKANHTYWVQVGTYGDTGQINLTIRKVTRPANDDRGSATVIPDVSSGAFSQSASLRNATWQSAESVLEECQFANNPDFNHYLSTVWYSYTTESSDPLQIDITADTGVLPIVTVYTGSSYATQHYVTCGSGGPTGTFSLSFSPENTTTYWIQVAGENGRSGPFHISFDYATVAD